MLHKKFDNNHGYHILNVSNAPDQNGRGISHGHTFWLPDAFASDESERIHAKDVC